MRSVLRIVVPTILLILAATFAGSVMCPPAHERDFVPAAANRYREVPAPVAPLEEPAPERTASTGVATAEDASVSRPGVLRVVVSDPDGQPVDLADVYVDWADRDGSPAALRGVTDGAGEWSHASMPFAAFEVHAVKDGWFPSEKVRIEFQGGSEEVVHLTIRPGGTVEGQLFGMDGLPVTTGWIRFTQLDSGEVRLVRPGLRGAFRSGPLPRGAWQLAWLRHEHADPAPGVTWTAAIEPGTHYRVEVTLPRPEDESAWVEGREPGVEVLP